MLRLCIAHNVDNRIFVGTPLADLKNHLPTRILQPFFRLPHAAQATSVSADSIPSDPDKNPSRACAV